MPSSAVTKPGSTHKCKQRLFGNNYLEEGLLDYVYTDLEEDLLDSDDDEEDPKMQMRQDSLSRLRFLQRDAVYEHLALELKANDT
jgi:hypothetical protein